MIDPGLEGGFPRRDAPFDEGWRDVHVGFEGDGVRIGGLEVWKQAWRPAGSARLVLWHPAYPRQRHAMQVYEIGDPAAPVRFATGELSNGVWGFFVPDGRTNGA